MKEGLLSLFSGIIGVILTIGYQHYFTPSQTFTFNFDDEEIVVTQSKYMDLVRQNEKLQNELNELSEKNQSFGGVDETNDSLKEKLDQLQEENNKFQNENS